jgi:hypothetical protein
MTRNFYHSCVSESSYLLRVEVFNAASMNMTTLWDVVVWYKPTDISEMFNASIIRAMMEELALLNHRSVCTTQHGATSQNTVIFIIVIPTPYMGSRGSSVSIVSGYDRAIGFRSCTMGTGGPFPGGKALPGSDADHSPSSSTEIRNE